MLSVSYSQQFPCFEHVFPQNTQLRSMIQPKNIGLGTIASKLMIEVESPIEIALSLFSTHLGKIEEIIKSGS